MTVYNSYTFTHSDLIDEESSSVEVSVSNVDTWMEVTDAYIRFLRGVGFVFADSTVVEYMGNALLEHNKAIGEDDEPRSECGECTKDAIGSQYSWTQQVWCDNITG